jgi:hypothetical protein
VGLGVADGVAWGIANGLAWGVADGVACGVADGVVCVIACGAANGIAVGVGLEGEARLAGDDSLRPRLCCGESIENLLSERGERGTTRGGGVNFGP